MPSLSNLSSGLVAAILMAQASAHFVLQYPATIGFDDDLEASAPCGSFNVNFSNNTITPFHVDGDTISLRSTHPETKWLFRATVGTATSANWTSLSQVIQQSSIGEFCRSDIKVPSAFAGKNGTIGIAADSPDGVLYQCAAVHFLAGAAPATPSVCTNSSGVTGTYVSDKSLASLPAASTPTGKSGGDGDGDSSPSASAAAAKSKSAANAKTAAFSYGGPLAWAGLVGSATLLARLL